MMYRCLTTICVALTLSGCRDAANHPASGNEIPVSGSRTDVGRCDVTAGENGPCTLFGPSLIELIARPELYDGKRVRTIGFVNFEFEGNVLYVAREDWSESIARNGIWIDPPPGFESDSAPARRQPNQRYVLVEGTFHRQPSGHLGMSSGSLDHVTRLDPWGRVVAPRQEAYKHP